LNGSNQVRDRQSQASLTNTNWSERTNGCLSGTQSLKLLASVASGRYETVEYDTLERHWRVETDQERGLGLGLNSY
jgi:hypothetical protein